MKLQLLFCTMCVYFLCTDLLNGQISGQVHLDPQDIPQFVDPLPHFAGHRVDASGGNLIIGYEPATQVAVSTGTNLDNGIVGIDTGAGIGNYWTYSISNDNGQNFTPAMWPSFTIEAQRGIPLHVEYLNNLVGQTYADVNLVADQTLHWANPLGAAMNDMTPYLVDIPVVPHLHGAEVPSESDGGPDAWFTPGMALTGPAWGLDGTDNIYEYPNTQEETTLWYHDHALGVTRLNVYAGLAGFYFLRGPEEEMAQLPGWSGDDLVQEVAPDGTSGTFNPEPYLPEIEMAFQDRMFDTNGGLYFPNEPSSPSIHPNWTPEFIGDVITVNGKTWPYLSVAPRKYRFRLLNGSNARFYDMTFEGNNPVHGKKIPLIIQIGTDGGLLDSPVPINSYGMTGQYGGNLLLAPGERVDIVIDFSKVDPGSTWTLINSAGTPYPDGDLPDPATTGKIMQFVVNGTMVSAMDNKSNGKGQSKVKKGRDKSKVPPALRNPMVKLSDFAGGTTVTPDKIRQLTLNEVEGPSGGPLEALVNNTKWDGNGMNPGLGITEMPIEGETELWQIINLTGDAHPIHLHLVQMQLVGRQMYDVEGYEEVYEGEFESDEFEPATGPPNEYNVLNTDGACGGNPPISSFLEESINPPHPNEQGWKDTYVMYPGEVTTFVVRFAPTDIPIDAPASLLKFGFDPSEGPGYVWHCHILDHEDNEMMRTFTVMPSSERSNAIANANLKSGIVAAAEIANSEIGFNLDQNYPNPGKYETEIRFQIPEAMHVRLTVFNQLGQQINVLIDSDAPAGNNKVVLNRKGLKSGIYFYRLEAGSNVATKKMILD